VRHGPFYSPISPQYAAKYTVLLSTELRTSLIVPGHLQTLESRPILGHADPSFITDLEYFGWHRHNVFRVS
jgi:hypothetical protein